MSTSPDAITREIRALEDRRYKAMIEGDLATLDALLGDGLVYTHSSSAVDGKASYLEALRAKKFVYRKVERPVENIQVHGDTAVVTGEVRLDVLLEGNPRALTSRFLNVWTKGPKGWQMVAWQSTPVPA